MWSHWTLFWEKIQLALMSWYELAYPWRKVVRKSLHFRQRKYQYLTVCVGWEYGHDLAGPSTSVSHEAPTKRLPGLWSHLKTLERSTSKLTHIVVGGIQFFSGYCPKTTFSSLPYGPLPKTAYIQHGSWIPSRQAIKESHRGSARGMSQSFWNLLLKVTSFLPYSIN